MISRRNFMVMAAASPLVGGIVNSALAEQNKKITMLADTFIPTVELNTDSIPYIRVMYNPVNKIHISITRETVIPITSIDAIETYILNKSWESRDVFSVSDMSSNYQRRLVFHTFVLRMCNRIAYMSRRGVGNNIVSHPDNKYLFDMKLSKTQTIDESLRSNRINIHFSRNCPRGKLVAFYASNRRDIADSPFCFNVIDGEVYYSELSHINGDHNIETYMQELKLDV